MNTKDTAMLEKIKKLILDAKEKAYKETSKEPEPELTQKLDWPINCTVGPGLEGAIACESKIGYVNGTKGWLIYRGYDIFDLCAHSTYEEVSYLLLTGELPNKTQLAAYNETLRSYRHIPRVKRLLMSFPVEDMSSMSALRLGTNLMRQIQTYRDNEAVAPRSGSIATDEDSIAMETPPKGDKKSIFEFNRKVYARPRNLDDGLTGAEGLDSCYHLISGIPSLAAAIARIRAGHLPIEPDMSLSHAANFLYMLTGEKPSPLEERIMDICMILHLDHGMNASTFASMVVASTLSDVYFSIGSGISALNGPLHGGANEQVLYMIKEIGEPENVEAWYKAAMEKKKKIPGFGHRVYKAYDPRAKILGPLAKLLSQKDSAHKKYYKILSSLEKLTTASLGKSKKIFPNVDYYSGLVYSTLGIPVDMFIPVFAVSRVAGWCARVIEYLENNRIFRPRSIYTGPFDREYKPINRRK